MSRAGDFLKRVLDRAPKTPAREFAFLHWSSPGKATEEVLGLLPVPGADPKRVLARVMDVDHYVGNVGHVTECRSIADPAYVPPERVRFYQRIKIPLLGEIHHELVLERVGAHGGFEVAAWSMLEPETEKLSTKQGMRSQYSDGAWLAAPGVIAYAFSSAPRREDVGFLKWKALTAGADVAAPKVLRENIEGMARWAAKS